MKKIILMVFILVLGGCSAKFAYNNASWLVYWYLDDYLELSDEQEERFDSMLEDWMSWHTQVELPKYHLHLMDIIGDVKSNNINQNTIASHRERARQHWVRARAHVAPDLVSIGATLSQDQIVYLFANLEEENREAEEEIIETGNLSEHKKKEKWTKRNQKGVKKWIGKLSKEQTLLIKSFYNKFESTQQHWLTYKREYQLRLRTVFASEHRDEIFRNKLHSLIVEPEKFRSPAFQAIMEANTKESSEYLLTILALMSDKQRKHLINEIDDFKEDTIQLQR